MAFAKEVSDFLAAFQTVSNVLGTKTSREGEKLDNEYRRAATESLRWNMGKEERDRQELLGFGGLLDQPSIYGDESDASSGATAIPSGKHVPVTIRNNNPGAISLFSDSDWATTLPGYAGKTPRPANEGGYYAKFSSPEYGVAAQAKLLQRYGGKGLNTINKIVNRWAAKPGAYASTVAKYTGFDPNEPLNMNDPTVLAKLSAGMSAHESGLGRPIYGPDVYEKAVDVILGTGGKSMGGGSGADTLDDDNMATKYPNTYSPSDFGVDNLPGTIERGTGSKYPNTYNPSDFDTDQPDISPEELLLRAGEAASSGDDMSIIRPGVQAGLSAPNTLPNDTSSLPFNVPAPAAPGTTAETDTSALPYNVDPNDPLGVHDPDYQDWKSKRPMTMVPSDLPGGPDGSETGIPETPESVPGVPASEPEISKEAKPRVNPPVRHKPGFDPLPQTSGHMGSVAQSGHESLDPGSQQFADSARRIPHKFIMGRIFKFASKAYGFDEEGISTTNPDDDPRIAAHLSGHGAAPVDLVDAVEDRVDPEHKMTDDARHIAAINRIWQFYHLKGDDNKADAAAYALMQTYKTIAHKWGAIAQKELSDGDLDAAVESYVKAYSTVPDGDTMDAVKNDDGTYSVTITNEKGEAHTESVLTPDQIMEHIMNIGPGDFDALILHKLTGEETTPVDTGASGFTEAALGGLDAGTGGTGETAAPAPTPGGLKGTPGPDELGTETPAGFDPTEGDTGEGGDIGPEIPAGTPSPDDVSGGEGIPTPEVTTAPAVETRNIPKTEFPPPLDQYMAPLLKWKGPNGQGPTAQQLNDAATMWAARQKAAVDYQKTLPTVEDLAALDAQSNFFELLDKTKDDEQFAIPEGMLDPVPYKVRPSLEAAVEAHNKYATELQRNASEAGAGTFISRYNQPPPHQQTGLEDIASRAANERNMTSGASEGIPTTEPIFAGAQNPTTILGQPAQEVTVPGLPADLGILEAGDQTRLETAYDDAVKAAEERHKRINAVPEIPKVDITSLQNQDYVDPIVGSEDPATREDNMLDRTFTNLAKRVGGLDENTINDDQKLIVAGLNTLKNGVDDFGLRPSISAAVQSIAANPVNGMTHEVALNHVLGILFVHPQNPELRTMEAEWVDDSRTMVKVHALIGDKSEVTLPVEIFKELDLGRQQIANAQMRKLANADTAAQADAEGAAITQGIIERQTKALEDQPMREAIPPPSPLPPAPDAGMY